MNRRHALTLGLAAIAAGPVLRSWALEQSSYPERPIKLVIPFAPGGLTDLVGRPWAEEMKPILGPVFLEHQPGAGGAVGAAAVARASPDGYTLLLGSASQILIPAAANGPYDPLKDLAPIALLVSAALAIVVHPALPVRTLQELVAYAKANPGKLSYGSGGVGSTGHIVGELLKALTGTADIVHVPYKGAGQMIVDLVSGQVPMLVVNFSNQVRELHESGKLRILAVTTAARVKIAADIPTVIEAGAPDMVFENFSALFAPSGTPKSVIDKIAQATRAALARDEFRQRLIDQGFEPYLDSRPQAARRLIEEEVSRWTPVIRSMILKPE